jgi:hypothetical protein
MKLVSEQILQAQIVGTKEVQITLDDDFNVPDSKADIDSVVKEWGNVYIGSVKMGDGTAQVKGNLDFALLYQGKNGAYGIAPVKLTGGIAFDDTINLPDEYQSGTVTCTARIDDLTVKAINSRKISVRAIVTLVVSCCREDWKELGCQVEDNDEGTIQVKTQKLSYTQMCVNMRDNLRIRQGLPLPAGLPNIGEIKWEEMWLKNVTSHMTDEGLTLSGELSVFVMYEADVETPKLQWFEGNVSFEEKLELNAATQDMVCFVKYNTISCNVEPKANYDGEMRDLSLEMVLELDVKGYLDKEKDIIGDIYAPCGNVDVTLENIDFARLVMRNNSRCKVNSKINLKDNLLMQIIGCTAKAQADSVTAQEDGLAVEGVMLVDIMYVTTLDSAPLCSIREAVPFSHKIALGDGNEGADIQLDISVENVSAVMAGNGEVSVKGSIAVDVICFASNTITAVTKCDNATFNQEEYLKYPCIVGFIANGNDNLWTIAKNNHTTVDIIRQENKNLPENCDEEYVVPAREKLLLMKA